MRVVRRAEGPSGSAGRRRQATAGDRPAATGRALVRGAWRRYARHAAARPCGLYPGDRGSRIPAAGALDAVDERPVGGDDQRLRERACRQRDLDLPAIGGDEIRKTDRALQQVLAHRNPIAVDRDAGDDKARRVEAQAQPVEARQFPAARAAPGCPEVEHDDAAAIGVDRRPGALEVGDLQPGQRLGRRGIGAFSRVSARGHADDPGEERDPDPARVSHHDGIPASSATTRGATRPTTTSAIASSDPHDSRSRRARRSRQARNSTAK